MPEEPIHPPVIIAPRKGLADQIADASEAIFAKANAAPPKPDATPPAPDPEDVELEIGGVKFETPEGIKSEPGKKSWRHYKDLTKKALADMETRLKDAEGKVANAGVNDAAELRKTMETLTKERDDLNAALGQTNLERTPEFQRHYVARESQIITEASALVPKESAERLAHVMAMPEGATRNEQLESILADLPALQQTELAVALRDIRAVRREKQEKLADWKSQLSQRDAVYSERTKGEQAAFAKAFDTQLATLTQQDPLFKPREGDATFNAELEKAAVTARAIFEGKISPQDRASAALYAASHKLLVGQLLAQQQEITKLSKTLEGSRAKVPTPGAGGGKEGGEVRVLGKPENMAERIARLAKEQSFVK